MTPVDRQVERADIRVTVEDLTTGEIKTVEIKDDYVIFAAGSCHVEHIQAFSSGTHLLTVKGRRAPLGRRG